MYEKNHNVKTGNYQYPATRIFSKYFDQNVLKCNSSTKSEIYDRKLIHGEASNSIPTSLQKSDSNRGVLRGVF